MILDCAGTTLDLTRPRVMGVLNVTPDSFSDGGKFLSPDNAVQRAGVMSTEGVAILDVGGESTRPGAEPVSVQQELDRVIPVIERIHSAIPVPISIDTSKPEVMSAAIAAGAGMINDVNALQAPGALQAAVECSVPVCLMHMQGRPITMQDAPEYNDVVGDVGVFLEQRAQECIAAGLPKDQIVIDPGFGFGKKLAHNLLLLKHLDVLVALGYPVLAGLSRKSMIKDVLDTPVGERMPASIALATLAVWKGATLIRAHDVAATVDAITMCAKVKEALINPKIPSLRA